MAVTGWHTFSAVAVGPQALHTCGLTTAGAAYCWGDNAKGALGDGTTTSSSNPVLVSGGLTFASISNGTGFTCGATTSGAGYCWGDNVNGTLGDGTMTDSKVPSAVFGGFNFATVSSGAWFNCGITSNREDILCWGVNTSGELGDGTFTSKSAPVFVND